MEKKKKEAISSKLAFHLRSQAYGRCGNAAGFLGIVWIMSVSYCSRHKGSGCDRRVCVLASLCEEK